MSRLLFLALSMIIVPSSFPAQVRAEAPIDTAVYAVSYLEVMPSSREMAVAAYKRYREMSGKDAGYVRFDLFEQISRPGHFVIAEIWKDQNTFEAHGAAAYTKEFLSKLEPIRWSDYDQRSYKGHAVGPAPAAADSRAIYVVTHVDFIGQQATAPALLTRLAEESRKGEGSVRFDVLQQIGRPNHYTIIEIWQTQKALDAHAGAAHTRQYRETFHSMSGSPLDERLYKLVG